MTEDQGDKLAEIGDAFWRDFSKLCGKYVSKMPVEMEAETVMHLGDLTSIYGSDYSRYIDRRVNQQITSCPRCGFVLDPEGRQCWSCHRDHPPTEDCVPHIHRRPGG